jgi:hypothetical protein
MRLTTGQNSYVRLTVVRTYTMCQPRRSDHPQRSISTMNLNRDVSPCFLRINTNSRDPPPPHPPRPPPNPGQLSYQPTIRVPVYMRAVPPVPITHRPAAVRLIGEGIQGGGIALRQAGHSRRQ